MIAWILAVAIVLTACIGLDVMVIRARRRGRHFEWTVTDMLILVLVTPLRWLLLPWRWIFPGKGRHR